MPVHETVVVRVGDCEAPIDKGIAPLIEQLWIAEIETTNSCQENSPGTAWIQFLTATDAADFLNLVAGEYSSELTSLYNRIRQAWDGPEGTPEGAWKFDANPWDTAVNVWQVDNDTIDEEFIGGPDFVFSMSIRFPVTDIPVLIERMREAN